MNTDHNSRGVLSGTGRPHSRPLQLPSLCIGAGAALFLFVGRWSFSRLDGGTVTQSFAGEPRLWVLVGVCMMSVLALSIRRMATVQWARWGTGADIAAVVFLAYMLASSTWAPDAGMAAEKAYEVFLLLLLALCLLAVRPRLDPGSTQFGFWGTLVVLGIGVMISASSSSDSGRLAAVGGGPITMGRNMCFVVSAALIGLQRTTGFTRGAAVLAGVIAGLFMLLTGSRGPLAALLCGGAVFLIHKPGRSLIRVLLIILAAGVACGIAEWTGLTDQIVEVLQYRVLEVTFEQRHLSGREDLWEAAVETGCRWLWFGIGLNGFLTVSWNYPHNIFLEVFAEGGLIGIALLAAFLGMLALYHWGHRRVVESGAVVALVAQLVVCQTSGDLFDSRGLFIIGFISTLYYRALPSSPQARHSVPGMHFSTKTLSKAKLSYAR